LAQIQNNEIIINSTIYISDPIDINLNGNYIKKNSFDGVKINDKEIILSYYIHEAKEIYKSGLRRTTYYDFFYYIKIIINEYHKLEKEAKFYNKTSSLKSDFHSLYLLKNNHDNLVSITFSNDKAQFEVYGYSTCQKLKISLFIGEELKINFNLVSLFKNDDIYFLNKSNQTINSIIDKKSLKPIDFSVKYNKNYIKYNYSYEDYDYIKNNDIKILFASSLNEKKSQKCELTLNFKRCRTGCELCTSKNDCFDKNWNELYIPTDFERFFFILPLSILAMLIVLILFNFAKCCVKEPSPNYGKKVIQSEIPLIQS